VFRKAAVQTFIDVSDVAYGKPYAMSARGLTVTDLSLDDDDDEFEEEE
jgi:hypothetical protein